MKTTQITSILKSDCMSKYVFQGVFPMDKLPKIDYGAYVVNTDDHDEPGEHWVAVYYENDVKEYFDPYGLPPLDNRMTKFLNYNYVYNMIQLQGPLSTACGFYCLYYILNRARGKSAVDIIDFLSKNDSEHIVNAFINKRYKSLLY